MKSSFIIILSIITLLESAIAQVKTDAFKIGLQFYPSISIDEFSYDVVRISPVGRILIRFGLDDYLNAEIGGGYGSYRGADLDKKYFSTSIFSADFRLLLKLIKEDSYPYLFLGAGILYYKVKDFPSSVSPDAVKDKGYSGLAPAGAGYQIRIAEYMNIDFQGGINISTTDNLNYYKSTNEPDGFLAAGLGILFGGGGPTDKDKDDLMSDEEEEIGTDPLNYDTDGDGLNDGEEVMVYKTDPLNKDSDADGLTDGEEVKKYQTNPLKADSDDDGINDLDELRKYNTNPTNPDSDNDSLSDGDEIRNFKTNPLERDSDNDTIDDADEIIKYKTNPNNVDSDNDNLMDQNELFIYKTDPLKKDTDGGSVDDGAEVKRGSDPLDPDDDILKVGKAVVLKGITFEFDSAAITSESEETLLEALKILKDNPDITVEIAGHTDEIGSMEYNRKLSLMRADAVKQWLSERGIQDDRLVTAGYGKDKPVAPNNTPENRSLNRRIEFIRLK